MIRLSKFGNCYTYYLGKLNYLIVPARSGRQNVFNVYIPNVGDPVSIGRELDLKTIRGLIRDYENLVKNDAKAAYTWYGDRKSVLGWRKQINDMRKKWRS